MLRLVIFVLYISTLPYNFFILPISLLFFIPTKNYSIILYLSLYTLSFNIILHLSLYTHFHLISYYVPFNPIIFITPDIAYITIFRLLYKTLYIINISLSVLVILFLSYFILNTLFYYIILCHYPFTETSHSKTYSLHLLIYNHNGIIKIHILPIYHLSGNNPNTDKENASNHDALVLKANNNLLIAIDNFPFIMDYIFPRNDDL